MTIFNLRSFLVKEAMGGKHMENRELSDWWTIEQILAGDEKWEEFVANEPSLQDVVSEIQSVRSGLTSKINSFYGIPREQVSQIFKTYVGYHPLYGAYMLSIGPYIGQKFAEAYGRCGYYTMRRRAITAEDLESLSTKLQAKYVRDYDLELEASDMQFESKSPGEVAEGGTRSRTRGARSVINMGNEDEIAAYTNEDEHPVPLGGSTMVLNGSGYLKMLRKLYGPFLDSAIQKIAQSRGIDQNSIEAYLSQKDFIKEVYTKGIVPAYEEAVVRGDAIINDIPEPVTFSKLGLKVSSGQITFSTLPSNKTQMGLMKIKSEVAEIMAEGITSPQEIQTRVNENAARSQAKRQGSNVSISLEEVQSLSQAVAEQASEESLTYEEVSTLNLQAADDMSDQKGFVDLRTTFEMAKLLLSAKYAPRDPTTGHVNRVLIPSIEVFDEAEFTNVDSTQLNEWLEYRKANARGETVEMPQPVYDSHGTDVEAPSPISPEDLKDFIGTEEIPGEEQIAPEEAEVAEVEQEVQEAITPEPTPEPTQQAPSIRNKRTVAPPPPPNDPAEDDFLMDLLGKTVKNLIKVARDLDQHGKGDAAEEVHRVIRKYQKRLM